MPLLGIWLTFGFGSDRYERYLTWYDKYVKKNPPTVKNVAETSER